MSYHFGTNKRPLWARNCLFSLGGFFLSFSLFKVLDTFCLFLFLFRVIFKYN